MVLSQTTLDAITKRIEESELTDCYSYDNELQIQQEQYMVTVIYNKYGSLVDKYEYHSEVSYNCYEDLSYIDFIGAEITEIEVYDEIQDTVTNIDNLEKVKYYN